MRVIVGLGNPGLSYLNTRHNLGFFIVDCLVKSKNLSSKNMFQSLIYSCKDVLLCKPQTYMNSSGTALLQIKELYSLENTDFLVIYDDLYLPTGSFRFSTKRSGGGHNGIKDIIGKLQGNDFLTLRVGIGPRERAVKISDYVLEEFDSQDRKLIDNIIPSILSALELFIHGSNIQELQNKFNF